MVEREKTAITKHQAYLCTFNSRLRSEKSVAKAPVPSLWIERSLFVKVVRIKKHVILWNPIGQSLISSYKHVSVCGLLGCSVVSGLIDHLGYTLMPYQNRQLVHHALPSYNIPRGPRGPPGFGEALPAHPKKIFLPCSSIKATHYAPYACQKCC